MNSDGMLSERLMRLRNSRKREGAKAVKRRSRVSGGSGVQIQGWKKAGEFLFTREKSVPSPFKKGKELVFSAPFVPEGNISVSDLVFYDLETTGLSTGAGVVAFLAGFGRIEGDNLIVKQFFLQDFPGEELFLRSIIAELKNSSILVSYNGRTFDRHLLMSRALMNRLSFPSLPEIDLLHLSRRLWREHISSCTLSSIEEKILGYRRQGDVPGRDIPDLYFAFQRTGNPKPLEGVFTHHLTDIVSLSALFQHIDFLWNNPGRCPRGERYSLGRLLLRYGRKEGEVMLQKVWEEEDPFSKKAGMILSFYYKRLGKRDLSKKIWIKLWEHTGDRLCGIELAKYYEHVEKDYKKALEITASLLSGAGSDRQSLMHRRTRLERKLGRSNLQ